MADPSAPRHRLAPNIVAGIVLALLAAGVLVWHQPAQRSTPAARPTITAAAADAIAGQIAALDTAGTRAEFVRAAGSTAAARAWAARTYDNLETLAVTDRRWRFIGGGEPNLRADGATEATVDVRWRAGARSGLGQAVVRAATVTLVLDRTGGGFAVRGAEADGDPLPLWLAGDLAVTRVGGSTVISIDGGSQQHPVGTYAVRARAAVSAVIGGAAAALVVVSPHTQRQAAQILAQPESRIGQIAAVTRTLDGSTDPGAAVAVVLNPAVFATMDARAAQVVMSHEATHMMTGATRADTDTWVSEGFADFVALHTDTAPLRVSAGQILRQVAATGAPRQLPSAADFDATRRGLGAVYESAWMAFRMLAAGYGDRAVLAFYHDVRAGASTATAAQSAFGLSMAALTRMWRAYLTKSASITS